MTRVTYAYVHKQKASGQPTGTIGTPTTARIETIIGSNHTVDESAGGTAVVVESEQETYDTTTPYTRQFAVRAKDLIT